MMEWQSPLQFDEGLVRDQTALSGRKGELLEAEGRMVHKRLESQLRWTKRIHVELAIERSERRTHATLREEGSGILEMVFLEEESVADASKKEDRYGRVLEEEERELSSLTER